MPDPTDLRLQCVIVSPEKALFDEHADFVAIPMSDGELGVLPGRAALIGRLGYGELRVRDGGAVQRFYIEGGFVQVRKNVITVLTSKALKAQDIKLEVVRRLLDEAESNLLKAVGPEAQEAQLVVQDRARAQLRVAQRASG